MNRQIMAKFKITQEMYEKFLRSEGVKDTTSFRKEFYRDLLDGKIVVENNELVRKKVRTK